jgi:hypothetical protein
MFLWTRWRLVDVRAITPPFFADRESHHFVNQEIAAGAPMRQPSYLGIAVILFCIALWFGSQRAYYEVHGATMMNQSQSVGGNIAVAPNNVAGLASLGFAIAGGLSLLCTAIIERSRGDHGQSH